MRTLIFAVDGQKLAKDGDFTGIAAGSKGYLKCRFELAGDWAKAKKIALFNGEYPVAVDSFGECLVPDEVTDGRSFKVRLAGQSGKMRMLTNQVLIEQVK